ncbi:hypothetical protein THAOC_21795, partial [Thalassiosira oceanica]
HSATSFTARRPQQFRRTGPRPKAQMEVPRKKARTCPHGRNDDGATAPTAARQIAELKAELEAHKREKISTEKRHNQVVRDLNSSYSDALEWAYSVKSVP